MIKIIITVIQIIIIVIITVIYDSKEINYNLRQKSEL